MMALLLALLLQDKVEMKDFQSFYLLKKPVAYSDRSSWPAIVDFGGSKEPPDEPACFVVTLADAPKEAYALACLTDLKTRYRIDPERVVVRGAGTSAGAALALAADHADLIAGCALVRARTFAPAKRGPPTLAFVGMDDPDRARVVAAAMAMKKSGIDVELRRPPERAGALFEAMAPKLHPKGTLQAADDMQRAGRYLDATLVCIDLLDKPEMEQLARAKLKSIEGYAIIELSKIEIAMADKKYKDAVLRCREASRQFAWVPPGERLRRRLAQLESRPDVQKALATED